MTTLKNKVNKDINDFNNVKQNLKHNIEKRLKSMESCLSSINNGEYYHNINEFNNSNYIDNENNLSELQKDLTTLRYSAALITILCMKRELILIKEGGGQNISITEIDVFFKALDFAKACDYEGTKEYINDFDFTNSINEYINTHIKKCDQILNMLEQDKIL